MVVVSVWHVVSKKYWFFLIYFFSGSLHAGKDSTAGKHTPITWMFLCTCTYLYVRNPSEMGASLGTMTHVSRVREAGQPVTWGAVLEQLCNHIACCLNRPLRDAPSFPAGKADQSHLSSPWSQWGMKMLVLAEDSEINDWRLFCRKCLLTSLHWAHVQEWHEVTAFYQTAMFREIVSHQPGQ